MFSRTQKFIAKKYGEIRRSFLHSINGTVAIIALLILIILFVTFIRSNNIGLVGFLFSLPGTYLGAYFAFLFQNIREKNSDARRNSDAINKVLLISASQYNILYNFKVNYLDQYASDPARMISLRAVMLGGDYVSSIRAEELQFLMHVRETDVNILLELSVQQGSFDACNETVQYRCDLRMNEVNPRIEEAGITDRRVDSEEIRAALGDRLFYQLADITDQVYDHVNSTLDKIYATTMKLHRAAKLAYPEYMFILIENLHGYVEPSTSVGLGEQNHG